MVSSGRLVSVLVVGLLLAACGPAATPTSGGSPQPTPTPTPAPTIAPTAVSVRSGGTLRVLRPYGVRSWEPQKAYAGAYEAMTYNTIFDTLATQKSTGQDPCSASAVPRAARSWKWVNDTTFEVILQPGMRFHNKPPVNGRQVTAQDVVYSFKRLKQYQSRLEPMTRPIVSIEAVSADTVRFVTDKPVPSIPTSVLSTHYGAVIFAPEAGGPKEDWGTPQAQVGSGPFMFKEWLAGVRVVQEKNPAYWNKGVPYVDELVWQEIPDTSTALASMRAGRLDVIVRDLPAPLALPLQGSGLHLSSCPESGPGYIFMQTAKAPFNDVRVRRAMSLAIDRQALIAATMGGRGVASAVAVAIHPFYLPLEGFSSEVRKFMEFNPAEAKRLLAEAGYPNGFEADVEMNKAQGHPYNEVAQALHSMLGQVGIRLNLRALETVAYFDKTNNATYKDILYARLAVNDPYLFLSQPHSQSPPSSNRSRVADPALDKLIDAFLVTFDEKQAGSLAREIQHRIAEQAYFISGATQDDFAVAQPWVKGFRHVGTMTGQLGHTWADSLWLAK